jgi:hypothetical protein
MIPVSKSESLEDNHQARIEDAEPTWKPTFPITDLPNYGPAPELVNQTWLNTDQPLKLVNLRGQVVLLDMWTFG